MKTVKIRFVNQDATPQEVAFEISKDGVKPVLSWYGGYHSGDEYAVFIDGTQIKLDRNGEPEGELP